MLDGFKKFILRGNMVDLAVGVVIGSAFSALVNALVKDLLTPLISAVAKSPDFADLYFRVNGSKFMYGEFLNALISFLLVAAAVYFFVVVPLNAFIKRVRKGASEEITKKTCPQCLSDIPAKATRCAFCTSEV